MTVLTCFGYKLGVLNLIDADELQTSDFYSRLLSSSQ